MTSTGKATVIGLGAMGTALAKALLQKEYEVTVWNRDQSKTARFTAEGGTAAHDVVSAIKASPLVIVCVSGYRATKQIFETEGVEDALRGRTILQLSTGTPKEARELDAWANQQGASCLNGDILAWPRQIGTTDATISLSGDHFAFDSHRKAIEALGTINYIGKEPGTSAVLFSAVMAYLAGSWIGFCHGALIYENEGLPTGGFGELIRDISPILAAESKHMGDVIQQNDFSDPESTINTTGLDLHLLVQQSQEAGISKELPEFAAGIFQRAINAGYGNEEHAAIIKVLRKNN